MIRIKPNVVLLEMLKAKGYSQYRLGQEKIFGQATITKFRRHGLPSWNELDKLCSMLHCRPWDIIEYIPGSDPGTSQDND